jgi:hypothetical protein
VEINPMKWLSSAVCGGLILALAVSLPRAQDAAIETAPTKLGAGPDKANPTTSKDAAPDAPAIETAPGDKTNTVRDPQAKLPIENRSGAKRADDAKDAPKAVDVDDELKIFKLQRASATSACDAIMQLYPDEFGKGTRNITADNRTNSLVVRGPRDLLATIEAVLLTLDDTRNYVRDNTSKSVTEAKPEVPSGRAPPREHFGQAYRQHEDQAGRLAAAYRSQLAAAPADRQNLDRLKAELQAEISAAFEARQVLQRADLDRLRGRLAQIEHQIDARQQRAQEIINNRIDELLHPETQWEADDDAADPAAVSRGPDRDYPRRSAGGERPVPEEPRGANSAAATARATLAEADKALTQAREKAAFTSRLEKKGYANAAAREAAAADLAAKEIRRKQAVADLEQAEKHAELIREEEPRDEDSSVRFVDRRGALLLREPGANPRKALLDAESAIATARAAAVQADKAFAIARDQADGIRKAHNAGVVPTKELYSAERDVAAQQARRERALVDLEQAERQAALAREDLAAQIELLKIDLDDAALRFEQASRDDARMRALVAQKAISAEEADVKSLALQQARLQYQRAKTLYDLYRKALPDSGSAGDKRTTDEKSATKRDDPYGSGKKE